MDDKAEQVIKRRKKEYIRDTFILILIIAILVTGIVLAIKFLKKGPASIVLYNENGEQIGTYSDQSDIKIPSKKGYSSSWVTDSGTTYDSIEAALANGEVSIKQVFSPIEYTVTLYLIGGHLTEDLGYVRHDAVEGQEELGVFYTKTYTVEDESFDLPAITKTTNKLAEKRGCTFAFWSNVNYVGKSYTASNLKPTETKTVDIENASDVVFYAVWEDVICTVHFLGLDGTFLFFEDHKETSLLSEEELNIKVLEYTPDGYDFGGFYADSKLHTPFDFTQEVDQKVMTVYTKWIPRSYTLTFKDANDEPLLTTTLHTDETIEFYDYSANLTPGTFVDYWMLNNEEFTSTVMPA